LRISRAVPLTGHSSSHSVGVEAIHRHGHHVAGPARKLTARHCRDHIPELADYRSHIRQLLQHTLPARPYGLADAHWDAGVAHMGDLIGCYAPSVAARFPPGSDSNTAIRVRPAGGDHRAGVGRPTPISWRGNLQAARHERQCCVQLTCGSARCSAGFSASASVHLLRQESALRLELSGWRVCDAASMPAPRTSCVGTARCARALAAT